MKFLVTGGTGFCGYNIIEALLEQNYQLRVLVYEKTDNFEELAQKKLELAYGDLLKPETLISATEDIDIIIHAAGVEGIFGVTLKQLQVHVKGTRNLLEAAKKNNLKRFVLISTTEVAAGQANYTADEKTIPKPKTAYDRAKYEGEKLVKEFCEREKIEYIIIRPSSVYGPYEMKHKAKLFQLIQKQKFFIVGDGRNLKSFVYTENLNQGILLALTKRKIVNNTYIISDKRPYEMNEFINTIADQLKVRRPVHVPKSIAYVVAIILETIALMTKREPLLNRGRIDTLTSSPTFSIKKAQRELGYEPKFNLEEGIAKTIAWYRKNEVLR